MTHEDSVREPKTPPTIVGFMAAFMWPSGGDRHFVEVTKRWARTCPTLALIPQRAVGIYGSEWQGVRLEVLPLAATDRLGTIGAYALRSVLALLRVPRGQSRMIAYSSSDFLPDILCGLLTKCINREARWVGCVFHKISAQRADGRIDVGRIIPSVAQRASHSLMGRWADAILVDNALLKEDLVRTGFSAKKVHVTSMGINRSLLDSIAPTHQIRYDACFLARLHPSKGIFDLLETWRTVVDTLPEARLAVVGGGPDDVVQELQARIIQEDMLPNVDLLGYLPDSQAYQALKSSRLFLFPSMEEGWGISIAEAMACGVPVVAYDLPHYAEVFPQGIVSVPMGDVQALAATVTELLGDNEKRARIGQQARETALHYDWDVVAQRELSLFESLLDR